MAKVIKLMNGDWYVSGRHGFEWIVKKYNTSDCRLLSKHIFCPKDWVGKKVRLKIEIVENG